MHLKDVSSRIHQLFGSSSLNPPASQGLNPVNQSMIDPGQSTQAKDQIQSLSPVARLKPISVLLNEPVDGLQVDPGVSAATQKALNAVPGSKWAGKLPGNSGRESAIILPKGFDANKPTEVIFYFHGHHGTIANSLTDPSKGMNQAIQDLAKTKNIILVMPQGPAKDRDYTWMNPANKESMAGFQSAALEKIQQLAPGVPIQSVTLKGHSAGGLALMNGLTDAVKTGGLQADRVDVLDGSYGYWASSSWPALKKINSKATMNVVYIPNTQTETDAKRLKNIQGVTLLTSDVGHGLVPKTFLGK